MRKLIIPLFILLFISVSSLLRAQNTNPVQEAMANYDYETALSLISQEKPTVPLLYLKGKALKSLGNNSEALKVYEEVIGLDSLNPRAYIEAAECCKSGRRPEPCQQICPHPVHQPVAQPTEIQRSPGRKQPADGNGQFCRSTAPASTKFRRIGELSCGIGML